MRTRERNPSDAETGSTPLAVKDNFFRETADARRRMESEDVQERERLVEQNLTLDNKGGHTQLHIVKAHPVSQVL